MPAAVLLLALVLAPQDDRDPDPERLPGEAERHFRIGRYDEAARELKARLAETPTDLLRHALVRALLAGRQYEEVLKEADALILATQNPELKADAFAAQGRARWRMGEPEAAKALCGEAVKLAEARGPGGFPEVRRRVAQTLGFLGWTRTESAHAVVWTAPGSRIDAAAAGRRIDEAVRRSCAAVRAEPPPAIDAFLFDDQRQADPLIGAPLNFAVAREWTLFALGSGSFGHEAAHVVSLHAAASAGKDRPRSAMLVEGFAVAFGAEPLWDRRMDDLPRTMLRQKRLPALGDLLKAAPGDGDRAACAGSFVRFLARRGKDPEVFRRFWLDHNDPADPWTALLDRGLEALEAEWWQALGRGE